MAAKSRSGTVGAHMATIDVQPDHVDLEIHGLDRVCAMRSRLRIPAGHVIGAEPADEDARRRWHGVRVGGAHVPGLCAGTYRSHGEWVFWDVHDPAAAITVRLQGERYDRLVVEVDDPTATLDRLRALPPADDPAIVPAPGGWPLVAPVLLALAVGVAIAVAMTLIELLG